uniref:Uncharacterized protein n=1 Tax=Glossina pallidipes TaxID=7398 RepID=A0A1B0ABB0_GLOPL
MNESINKYELQLLTVEKALLVNENPDERNELLELRDNLIELLALTGTASEEEREHVPNGKAREDQDIENHLIKVIEIWSRLLLNEKFGSITVVLYSAYTQWKIYTFLLS